MGKHQLAALVADALHANKSPGWAFQPVENSELVAGPFDDDGYDTARALFQIRTLTLAALRKGMGNDWKEYPDGHVLPGLQRTAARAVVALEVYFIAAPPGVSVLTRGAIGLLRIDALPVDGWSDFDFATILRTMGLRRCDVH